MAWRPILAGPLQARAVATARAIGGALRSDGAPPRGSLMGGRAGLALLHAYLGDGETALRFRNDAIDAAAESELPPSFGLGFTGIGWVAEHLERRAGGSDDSGGVDAA